jgi:hypothetical protein
VQEEKPVELVAKALTPSASDDEVVVVGSFMPWSQTSKLAFSPVEGGGGEAGWSVHGAPQGETSPAGGEAADGKAGPPVRGRGPNAPNGAPNKPPNTCRRFHRPNMIGSSIVVNETLCLVVHSLAILLVHPMEITVVTKSVSGQLSSLGVANTPDHPRR